MKPLQPQALMPKCQNYLRTNRWRIQFAIAFMRKKFGTTLLITFPLREHTLSYNTWQHEIFSWNSFYAENEN
jgi:hypothetical protein